MSDKSIDEIVKKIVEKSGKTEEDVQKLIKDKVEKFSGLLTEQGAAFMVGKEMGVGGQPLEEMKISELEEGMKGIEIHGKVEAVFPVKEFERNGKKAKLQSIIISDGEGEIRLTLWNDQAEKNDLTRGSEVVVSNAIVSTYNEKKQLGLGFNGELKVLNKAKAQFEKLNNLKGGMQGINVVGKLLRKFPVKEFDSGERKGKLCNFQFGDETALLRATAWNEQADKVGQFNEGDALELINAYTKDGMFGVELHAGYSTQIKTSDKELPSIKEIMKENIEEKKINVLVDNENVTVKGKVKEIVHGNLHYLVCSKCGKKVSKEEGGVICEECGEVEPCINPIISLIIEDDTGSIKATMFGNTALDAMSMKKEEFEKALGKKTGEMIIEDISENVLKKEIALYGYARDNNYSNEREFMVKEIID